MNNIEIEKLQNEINAIDKQIEEGVTEEEFYELKNKRGKLIEKLSKLGVYTMDDFTEIPVPDDLL